MSAQHTPGPWEAVIDRQRPTWVWVAPADWHTRVCRVTLYAGEEEEQQANARLIAAAPDLLALVIQYRDDLRRPPSTESAGRRLQAVNAAIAKATGQ